MTTVIKATKLSKIFGRGKHAVEALNGVDIDIPEGQVTGLIGPNGAGKSTFIKLMLGYLAPSQGVISVFGQVPGSTELNLRLGYLPENPAFPPYLSGLEILVYVARLRGMSKKTATESAWSLLEEVDISHAAKRRVMSYSKGMAQRLGLAQALVGNPELLILDEPMSGLDPIGRSQIKNILGHRSAEGASILFCSHILDDVERLSDQLVMLNHGQVVYEGTVDKIIAGDNSSMSAVIEAEKPLELSGGQEWQQTGKHIWDCQELSPENVDLLIAAAYQGDIRIIKLHRASKILEDVFVQFAQKEAHHA